MPKSNPPASALSSPSSLSDEELAAWRGLLRVHSKLTRRLDLELEHRHGLPLTSYEVLLHLVGADGGAMRMSELADSVLLSRSGLTRQVDRLARDGLVERRKCPTDARGSLAAITASGRSMLAHARETHLAGVREHFVERFGEGELRTLGEMWDRLLADEQTPDDLPGC